MHLDSMTIEDKILNVQEGFHKAVSEATFKLDKDRDVALVKDLD